MSQQALTRNSIVRFWNLNTYCNGLALLLSSVLIACTGGGSDAPAVTSNPDSSQPPSAADPSPKPSDSSDPQAELQIFDLPGGHELVFDKRTAAAVIVPKTLSLDLTLIGFNANAQFFKDYTGPTWANRCIDYREQVMPYVKQINELRISLAQISGNSDEAETIISDIKSSEELMASILEPGNWHFAYYQIEVGADKAALIELARKTRSNELSSAQSLRVAELRDYELDPKSITTNPPSLMILAGDPLAVRPGEIFTHNRRVAHFNEYCDLALGQFVFALKNRFSKRLVKVEFRLTN